MAVCLCHNHRRLAQATQLSPGAQVLHAIAFAGPSILLSILACHLQRAWREVTSGLAEVGAFTPERAKDTCAESASLGLSGRS